LDDQEIALSSLVDVADDNKVSIVVEGGLPPLIRLLKTGSPVVKEKAASILRVLATVKDNKVAISEAGGIEPLIDVLVIGSPIAKEHAAGALKNLAVNDDNEVAIVEAGGIDPLIAMLDDESVTDIGKENAIAALLNLCYVDEHKLAIVQKGAIRPLVLALSSDNHFINETAADIIMILAVNDKNQKENMVFDVNERIKCYKIANCFTLPTLIEVANIYNHKN
jgi:vacuolar protein 8